MVLYFFNTRNIVIFFPTTLNFFQLFVISHIEITFNLIFGQRKEIKKKRKEQLEANQKTNRVGGKSRTTNKRREKAQKKGTKDKDVGKWKG